jgi:hypothetical protein
LAKKSTASIENAASQGMARRLGAEKQREID